MSEFGGGLFNFHKGVYDKNNIKDSSKMKSPERPIDTIRCRSASFVCNGEEF
jgi:hypothetical protein